MSPKKSTPRNRLPVDPSVYRAYSVLMTTTANTFASKVPQLQPKVWSRGTRTRVYVRYPRGYQGGAGGGDLGYVDFSGETPSLSGLSAPDDLLVTIRAAIAEVL